MRDYTIEEIREDHPKWADLLTFIEDNDLLRNGVLAKGADKSDRCLIMASMNSTIVGLLMFLIQPIGPEVDCPVLLNKEGVPLKEAKIRSFFVAEDLRGRGIGTGLQEEALVLAARMGAYQVRSRSEVSRKANYTIKLKLGYAASPEMWEDKDENHPEGIVKTPAFCFTKRV